jgi:putative flippase GtrA
VEHTKQSSNGVKRDIFLAGLVGFLVAIFLSAVKTTGNIEKLSTIPFVEYALIVFPILSAIGMAIARFLGTKIPVAIQGAKFLLVGALNTFLDLAVLNILIAVSGITGGIGFSIFKGISFICAVGNSYIWNKYWTFGQKRQSLTEVKRNGKEFTQFFAVAATGFLINVGSASFLVNMVGPQLGISESTWPTVGALAGTFLVLTWNFFGYKLIVFKR